MIDDNMTDTDVECNVYLADDQTITLGTEAAGGMSVGVTLADTADTFVASGATVANKAYFSSDDSAYSVFLNRGETDWSLRLTSAAGTITNPATGNVYTSLSEALADALDGETVKLTADTALTENETIQSGRTLDLNGYNLTVNSMNVINGGNIVDNGAVLGSLIVAKNKLAYNAGNGGKVTYLPIYCSDAYKFVEFHCAATWSGSKAGRLFYGLDDKATAELCSLLKQDSTITIGFDLNYTNNGNDKTLHFVASASQLKTYLNAKASGKSAYFYVNFVTNSKIKYGDATCFAKSGNTNTYVQ